MCIRDSTQTYLYITELDATMEHDIIQNSKRSGVDSFAYYLNGAPVSLEQMEVFTDADLLLAYLDCKYDDYTFSDVRSEIDSLHDALHSLRLEEYTTSSTTTDSEGNEVTTHTTHLDQYLSLIHIFMVEVVPLMALGFVRPRGRP